MHKLILTISFALTTTFIQGQSAKFWSLLEEGGLEFTMPANFDTIATRQNPHMNDELAIQSKTDSFEIRYAIHPLKKRIEAFEKMAADTSSGQVVFAGAHPNKSYKTVFMTVLINTSLQPQGGGAPAIPKFGDFKPEAVKNEFNADWGATSGYPPRTTFDSTYKNCMTVALHKDNAADVYIFYLFNKKETMMRLLPTVFHAIKYR